jgi:DNA-binding CsgD family transcriptional regulator
MVMTTTPVDNRKSYRSELWLLREIVSKLDVKLNDESLVNYKGNLPAVLATISERERLVLSERLSGSTLAEIGQRIGRTAERVRTIERRAIRKLQHPSRGRILCGLPKPKPDPWECPTLKVLTSKYSLDEIMLDQLMVNFRTANCLKTSGMKTLRDLISKSFEEISNMRNFGRKSFEHLLRELSEAESSEVLEWVKLSQEKVEKKRCPHCGQLMPSKGITEA